MKVTKADIYVKADLVDGNMDIEVAASLESRGGYSSTREQDHETVVVLLMAVSSVLGKNTVTLEEFQDICKDAYELYRKTPTSERFSFQAPIDTLPN